MATDTDRLTLAITDLVPKLLTAMEAFEQVQRNAAPGNYPDLVSFLSPFAQELQEARNAFASLEFPDELKPFGDQIAHAAEYSTRACDSIAHYEEGMGRVMQAMRAQCRAQEFAYPLAAVLSPVSKYFLEHPARDNAGLLDSFARAADTDQTGLMHADNARDKRGGFTLYVPENLATDEPLSVVVALHGGTGHGADFIWSWLREARTRGFIVLAPTSQQDTWSLMGEEHDMPALLAMLNYVKTNWQVDEEHILLTGMSDGGTYSLLAGLRENSPFTHLAPFSGVLHPEISMTGDIRHASGRRIYLVHGTQDWMFPIETAYMAVDELERAGAALTFREVKGLSHTYARSENPALIEWFNPRLKIPT
ncbi:MAG: hypothetical protein KDI19_06615 [Pseudomonadales bacterium]|nr:hypothetical protein [Pseudomonadales bacterium]